MKLTYGKSKNKIFYYISKSFRENGKSTTKVIERLGTIDEIKKRCGNKDPIKWAKKYAKELTENETKENETILVKYNPAKQIDHNDTILLNGGYLFLEQIFYQLKLDKICSIIMKGRKTKFDFTEVLLKLICARIIFPSSKLSTYHTIEKFIETSNIKLQHIYRGLELLAKNNDYIQSEVYKNSNNIIERDRTILYYDCTNYYFEINEEDDLRKYGVSKENRPNPIVQMGLFIDSNGLPLAFTINPGNTNEQTTLKPLEKQIINDFELKQVVICTDAGLSSYENRLFNNCSNKKFVTTQSIKKLKGFLKDFCLDTKGWTLIGDNKTYDISQVDEEKYYDKIFYKERWINENKLEQRLIVSYSIKYKKYLEHLREKDITLAQNAINNKSYNKVNANNYKKYIKKNSFTNSGEVANNEYAYLDEEKINEEKKYDGYYAVCTNLEIETNKIIEINRNRWEIEESFRIMKSEFKARPVYLSKPDRIKAHFLTCYLALLIYRLLEKKLNATWTCNEIIEALRNMNFYKLKGQGIIPLYKRTDITDKLHEIAGFRTDNQIITTKKFKNILKIISKSK